MGLQIQRWRASDSAGNSRAMECGRCVFCKHLPFCPAAFDPILCSDCAGLHCILHTAEMLLSFARSQCRNRQRCSVLCNSWATDLRRGVLGVSAANLAVPSVTRARQQLVAAGRPMGSTRSVSLHRTVLRNELRFERGKSAFFSKTTKLQHITPNSIKGKHCQCHFARFSRRWHKAAQSSNR